MKWINYLLFFILAGLYSCGSGNPKNSDTATNGNIKISADESFQPIVDAELNVFHAIYKYAHVNVAYRPEGEAFRDLLIDSVRLIFSTRLLDSTETEVFKRVKIIPRINKIAIEGVALIVNNENPDSMLTMRKLSDIFTGKTTKWGEINKANKSGEIQIVFDNSNSSNLRFVREKFNLDSSISKQVFSAGSNKAVIEYVKSNKQSIGVIGVNWISDGDDSTAKSFQKSVKVMAISSLENPVSDNDYYQPYQAYIAQDLYPLKRDLYIISREARVGLGTGFASFVASDRGQRIVLKSGLVPATVPLRIVNVKKEPL